MKRQVQIALLGALPFVLAACQGEKKTTQGGTAQGEILPGSASDAMLPLDTVRSQPPYAPPTASSARSDRGSAGTATDASEDETDAAPEPAPSISIEPVD